MTRVAVVVLLLAACGRDVRLGTAVDAMPDVMADGNGNPFMAGAYAMQFLDPPMQGCDGTLAGMESSFTTVTRASLGLTDGSVTFTTPTGTMLSIAGAAITSAVGQSSIALAPNISNPPGLWDGLVSGSFGAGPLSTTRSMMDIAADSTTTQPIQAQLAILYETSDQMGACTVGFEVAFTHQ
jgi:hypothetical protein